MVLRVVIVMILGLSCYAIGVIVGYRAGRNVCCKRKE